MSKYVPLGEAVDFIRGITFKPDQLIDPASPGAVACMRTKNIQESLDESDIIAVPNGLVRSEEKFLRRGDILLSSANSWELVGKAVPVPELPYKATAGGFISIIRPKNGTDARFLYHWISSPQIQHEIRHCGRQTTNISNLDVGRFLDLSFPYPTGDEQRRIAAILDKADAIRRRRRQALAEIDNLLRATFLDMFGDTLTNLLGWPVRELREVVDPARPITYGIVQAGPHVEGGIPYIRTSDFDGHSLRSSGYGMTSPDIAARFQRSEVRTGDLVFCIRASVGSVARVPDFLNGANLTQGTALIAPGPAVEPDYLLNTLQQNGTQAWIQTRQKGATFKEITLAALRETPIPMPPKNLQQRFASFYIRTSDRCSRLRELNMEADALFSALSQRAFRGEL